MKKTINLSANLGHVSTTQSHTNNTRNITSANSKEIPSSVPMNMCNEIVDALIEQRNVYPILVQIKHLLHFDIPLSARPEILKELNKILGALFYQYPSDVSIFKQAQATMTLLNSQIDKKPQNSSHMQEIEWEELQKTVYLLCDWEDQITCKQDHIATATVVE